ncbi:MAG: hypothetical protein F4Z86_06535, partial [Gemmatimonadetes bacterium]|nr:hypothetical protein [Gemmatimonadota bacterium]
MAEIKRKLFPSSELAEDSLRWTVVVLFSATLVFACVAATFLEFKSRSAHMAMANLPLAVLLPFVAWLLVNAFLKRFAPRLSMTSAELRLALSMLWVGGSFAGYNWITQWVGAMAAPRYYASPENRWQELIFDYLPWWMFPSNFPGVTEGFFLGLEEGAAVPWGAWIAPIFWAMSAGLAMTAIGLGLTAVFQKQWVRHERLTYPLAQVPLDLTEGFDGKRGWPPFMRNWLFWVGFTVAALPLLWNLIEYWTPGFPRLAIFDPYYGPRGPRGAALSRYLSPFSYRILPPVLGFTFLCDLNILFSIWSLWLAGQVGLYGMSRVGFSVGLAGQEAKPTAILGLFTHGVSMGLAIWAIWVARGHLRKVFRQVLRPPAGGEAETAILSPRLAVCGIFGGGIYMVFWLYSAGYSAGIGLVWLLLFWASILVVMKFLAASGFAYLFPSFGTSILDMTVGASRMQDATQVGLRLVNWRLLAGWRLPAALPHVERLVSPAKRVGWVVIGSLMLGMLAAILYTVSICYESGGSTFRTWSLVGAPVGMYEGIAKAVAETDRTVTDPGKIGVWVLGGVVAGVIQVMQSRFSWWPFHPLGVMLMSSGYVRLYVLDIFLVWLSKLLVLSFGGISLYRRVKPCCYGLIVGYVCAVG